MDLEEDEPNKSARIRQSLDRAYDPDDAESVDNRMIAMMLQLSSDEEPCPTASAPYAPGFAARLLRRLRR